MIKQFRNSNFLKSFLLLSVCSLSGSIVAEAQTVTLFRTGVIVLPRYSSIGAAIAATIAGDSLVLSGHTFKENNLSINKNLKLTGTTDSNGSTTIDAASMGRGIIISAGNVTLTDITVTNGKVTNGAGGGIYNYGSGILTLMGNSVVSNSSCSGIYANGGGIFSGGKLYLLDNTKITNNYSDESGGGVYAYTTFVLSGNAKISNNKTAGSGGGLFSQANGAVTITNNAMISNNTADVAGGGMYGVGTLSLNAKISNNKADFGGGIAAFNDVLILKDSAMIDNNTATTSGGGIWLNNCSMYGSDNFQITNNKIPALTGTLNFGGAIYNVNGNMTISGGKITGNQSPVATIYNSSGASARSIVLNGIHIYNPQSDGTRLPEVINSPSLASSYINFTTDSCWWGQNDITKLIVNKPGTSTGYPYSYLVLTWILNEGAPITPTMTTFPLRGDFHLNTAGIVDSLRLRTIKATFSANKGSFTPSFSYKDSTNNVRSIYKSDVTDSITITAIVDADTFRSGKILVKGLGINENQNTSNVKIYPNPATENLYINHAQKGTQLFLYSSEGRIVLQKTMNTEIEDINLSTLAKGVYILQLTDDSGNKIARQILKQ